MKLRQSHSQTVAWIPLTIFRLLFIARIARCPLSEKLKVLYLCFDLIKIIQKFSVFLTLYQSWLIFGPLLLQLEYCYLPISLVKVVFLQCFTEFSFLLLLSCYSGRALAFFIFIYPHFHLELFFFFLLGLQGLARHD